MSKPVRALNSAKGGQQSVLDECPYLCLYIDFILIHGCWSPMTPQISPSGTLHLSGPSFGVTRCPLPICVFPNVDKEKLKVARIQPVTKQCPHRRGANSLVLQRLAGCCAAGYVVY